MFWACFICTCLCQFFAVEAAVKIAVMPESVEVGQELNITIDNPDPVNYTIKKILFTALQRTQEFVYPNGFSVLAENSLILRAPESFRLSCSLNAVGTVTVTALSEQNTTLATTTFVALKSREALPALTMFPVKANAEEYRVGETITFSFQANCHEYSLFKFTNVNLSVSAPGFGKITLFDMPSFSFDATMSPISLKPWSIPHEYAYAGITTARLKYTATWPTGRDIIESSIPFFIKGSQRQGNELNYTAAGHDFVPALDCDSLIKATIATKDNEYFIYKAKVTFEEAARVCSCFHMVLVALDSSNKAAIRSNVLGTIGEGTIWLQGYNNLHAGERVAAFVNNSSIIVERYTVTTPAQFFVICKPRS